MTAPSWLRSAFMSVALATIVGCAKDKPAADGSEASAGGLPAPDTVKAAPVAAPDSVKLKRQADTKGAATKGAPATIPPKVPAGQNSKSKIIGRDSTDTKPKLIGVPVVADTARRRPPR